MARCSVGARASAVCTAARGPSLYATAAVRPQIKQVGIWNASAVACTVGIARATATGTQGAGLTEVCTSDSSNTIVATAFNTHTADATVGGLIRNASLGAAIGSGIIWTFEDGEFLLDNATTAGCVIVCPTGTGQLLDFYIAWKE